MSASLVGSEMCIRDSGTATAANGAEPRSSGPCKSVVLRPRAEEWEGRGCLLYTSDAADDM
eukprot:3122037-Alexandrium_andersonii.AAC.1